MKDLKYEVYMGLNQKTLGSNLNVEEVKTRIENVFKEELVDFSMSFNVGGYIHEDSTYVLEDGVKMTFIGRKSPELEKQFLEDLKNIFNQESILVIKKEIEVRYE